MDGRQRGRGAGFGGRTYREHDPNDSRSQRGAVFFFQAEDGIRDYRVTGVQTCVPISDGSLVEAPFEAARPEFASGGGGGYATRSEEGRVGEKGRFRWSPAH